MLSLTQFKESLSNQFDVLCFVDLSELTQNKSAVFKLFRTYYQTVYSANQRLVLYSQYTPDLNLLVHIQHAAALIDISNNFILLCCPGDMSGDLLIANQSHGNNCVPIQHQSISVESAALANNYSIPKTICPMPWMNLEIDHQGAAKACCISQEIVGQITDQSLSDIFHGNKMSGLRQQFLNNEQPTACKVCWKLESAGQTSLRKHHLGIYGKDFYSDWIDRPAVRSLDLKPGNVCNFKCRSCNVKSSSLYANEVLLHTQDQQKINWIKQLSADSKWFDNDSKFIDELNALLPGIKNLDFYGGEPFLLKNIEPLLSYAIDHGYADQIRLHFNTNGSVFSSKLISILEKFKHVDIAISIDNIGTRFELERGGTWSEIENNVRQFQLLDSNKFHVYIFPTINIQNVFYLDELLGWAQKIDIEVILNFLYRPEYLNIDYMTDQGKQLVVTKYQNHPNPQLQNIAKRIAASPGGTGELFIKHMTQYDSYRNQNFGSTHPEIARAMTYPGLD